MAKGGSIRGVPGANHSGSSRRPGEASFAMPTELQVLRRLHEFNTKLGGTADLEAMLGQLLEAVMDLHRADFGNIQMYDARDGKLRIAVQRGFSEPFLKNFDEVDADDPSACGMALRSHRRVVFSDIENEPAYAPSLAAARAAGYRAVQSTPMMGPNGELVGMISTHFKDPRHFSEAELWLTDLFSGHAGAAIAARMAADALDEVRQRQRLLLSELQHRVRNTLAVIRSIIRRTAASSSSVEQFQHHLDGRIDSFARTQAHVTRDPDSGIDLELLIHDELQAYAAGNSPAVSIEGPPVRIPAKQAETVGLAIHELVNNAIKHGALADDGNQIEVRWSVTGQGNGRLLTFAWRETLGERTIGSPARTGFGMELLDQVMRYSLDAEPSIIFAASGISYSVKIPLSQSRVG